MSRGRGGRGKSRVKGVLGDRETGISVQGDRRWREGEQGREKGGGRRGERRRQGDREEMRETERQKDRKEAREEGGRQTEIKGNK